jgi:hypothetical protein
LQFFSATYDRGSVVVMPSITVDHMTQGASAAAEDRAASGARRDQTSARDRDRGTLKRRDHQPFRIKDLFF